MLSDFLQQYLDRSSSEPSYRQLYRLLRQAILSGNLPAGRQLPPSRQLAAEIGLSRNTVTHVYEQLALEGYVVSLVGSGTFVADTVPDQFPGMHDLPVHHAERATAQVASLSTRGTRLIRMAGAAPQQWGAFHSGVPDVTQFPLKIWTRLQTKYWRRARPELLTYASGGGYMPLRAALAEYLRTARSVTCDPEQIIITSGSHQSMHLVAQLLSDAGDDVWIEDPCYWGARNIFQSVGLKGLPIPVDAEGLAPTPEHLRRPPRFIFVSPSHQYPLGVVMSVARRRMLLEYARLHGCWIVEDDYDSEFRYGSRPLASLQGLDTGERVIYLGSFSKIMFPGLRLGYIVVPKGLVGSFETGLSELYREGQGVPQAILAEFISEGHFASHIRRMRVLYGERRAILIDRIRHHFGTLLPVSGGEAGLHLVAHLPQSVDDEKLSADAFQAGVFTRPLSHYYDMRSDGRRGILLGYACVPNEDIAPEFVKLARVISAYLELRGSGSSS